MNNTQEKTNNQPTSPETCDPYNDEDEINLLDLLLVLLKHKKLIFWMVFITGLLSVGITLFMPNIYRSEATIALRPEEDNSLSGGGLGGLGGVVSNKLKLGGNEKLEKLKVSLNSRELTRRVIEKYNLMPVLFENEWDKEKKTWKEDEIAPTIQDAWELILNDLLKTRADDMSGTIKVGFDYKDPEFSKKTVEYFITELSAILREEVLSNAREKKKFFSQQLSTITDSLLREKIYSFMAKEIERETFAKAQQYYGFMLIDPPVVPDQDKKVSPKRAIICILSVLVAFFLSIFLAFILEFIQRIKKEDPERFNAIANELKLWKIKS